MGERERLPHPASTQGIPLRRCQWRDCPREAAISIYNRVLDECLPDDAPIAIVYSCDRHARRLAQYCHAVDEDISYLGPF
jgi:hypothetical protein